MSQKKPATPKKLEVAGFIFLTRFVTTTQSRLLSGREGDVSWVCRATAGIEAPNKDVIERIWSQARERKAGLRRFFNKALHNVVQATGMIQADRGAHRAAGRGPLDRCAGRCSR